MSKELEKIIPTTTCRTCGEVLPCYRHFEWYNKQTKEIDEIKDVSHIYVNGYQMDRFSCIHGHSHGYWVKTERVVNPLYEAPAVTIEKKVKKKRGFWSRWF